MGDDDAVCGGETRIDMVIADAEAHHDLKIGQAAHQRRIDHGLVRGRDDRSDLGGESRQRLLRIGREPQPMKSDALFDRAADFRYALGRDQNVIFRHLRFPSAIALAATMPRRAAAAKRGGDPGASGGRAQALRK